MSAVAHQVVEGDEAMGLAATESGLGLDYGVAARAVKPLHGVDQQGAHTRGDVGPVEETDRVPVFVGAGASVVYLLKIGGKLGLPEATFGHIVVGANYLPPGPEGAGPHRRRLHALQHLRDRAVLLNCRDWGRLSVCEKPVADLLHRPLFDRGS